MRVTPGIGRIAIGVVLALAFSSCAARRVEEEMPFPDERIKTFAFGATPVDSNTLNLIQDAIIANKRGPGWKNVSPARAGWIAGASVAFQPNTGRVVWSGAGEVWIGLDLQEGEVLTDVEIEVAGDGAADFTNVIVYRTNKDGTVTNITTAPTGINDPGAAFQTLPVPVTDETIGDGESVYLSITANAANAKLGTIAYKSHKHT